MRGDIFAETKLRSTVNVTLQSILPTPRRQRNLELECYLRRWWWGKCSGFVTPLWAQKAFWKRGFLLERFCSQNQGSRNSLSYFLFSPEDEKNFKIILRYTMHTRVYLTYVYTRKNNNKKYICLCGSRLTVECDAHFISHFSFRNHWPEFCKRLSHLV